MIFSIVPLLVVAACVSAADIGSWETRVSEHVLEDGKMQLVHACFTSDEDPKGLSNDCVFDSTVSPPTERSDENTFWYEYDGTSVTLQQNIQEENSETVFGTSELAFTDGTHIN